jgi:cell division protein FtsL
MSIDVEYAIKKDIRNNPVVREIDQQQRADFRRTVGIVGLVVLMLLFSTWQRLRVVKGGYEVAQLQSERVAALKENRLLRLEFERASAPSVIDERAKKELHMVVPTGSDVIFIDRVRATKPAKSAVVVAR